MVSSTLKWIAGSIVFLLPTIVVVLAKSSGWSDFGAAFWGSLILAGIIPSALILSSSLKWRIAYVVGLLVLLAGQFCLALLILLAGFRS